MEEINVLKEKLKEEKKKNSILENQLKEKSVELDSMKKKMEKDIIEQKKLEEALRERIKELTGLANLEEILYEAKDLEEFIYKFVNDIAPKSIQFPEKVIVEVEIEDKKYCTKNKCNEMKVYLSAPIRIGNKKRGEIKIGYEEDLPFIPEFEQDLLNSYARKFEIFLDRYESGKALKQSEKRLSDVFKGAQDGIAYVSKTGKVLDVNPSLLKILDLKREEIVNKSVFNITKRLLKPKDIPRIIKILKSALSSKFIDTYEVEVKGKVLQVSTSLPRKEFSGITGIIRDITEQKKTEKTKNIIYEISKAVNTTADLDELFEFIHKSLNNLVNTKNFYIALYDESTDILSFPYFIDEKDKSFEPVKVRGSRSNCEYVIKTKKSFFRTQDVYKKMIESGELIQRGSKSKIWMGVPLKIKKRVIGLMVLHSYTDPYLYSEDDVKLMEFVSEQVAIAIETKRAEDALRESEEKFRTLTENLNIGIYRNTPGSKGKFIEVNSAMLNIYGYKNKEDIYSINVSDLYQNPEERAKVSEKILKHGYIKNEELNLKKKDGTSIICRVSAVAVKNEKGEVQYFDGTIEDITELKKAREALRVEREYFSQLFENAPEAIVLCDTQGKIIKANKEFTNMFGYSPEETVGSIIDELVAPENLREEAGEITKKAEKYKFTSIETLRKRKDGKLINVSILGAPFEIENGKRFVFGIYRDITERKKAESNLKLRIKLEKIVSSISTKLVGISMEKLDQNITEGLEMIGEFANVDRSYIFLLTDNNKMDNTHKWCKEGISPQIDNLKDIPLDNFPWWMEKLNKFENIYIPDVDDLPKEAESEKNILQQQDIKSLIVVPMIIGKKLAGFMGFDSVTKKRIWKEENVSLIKTIANIFIASLERKRIQERIIEQKEFLNNVLESIKNPLYVIDANNYKVLLANSSTFEGTLKGDERCYVLTHKINRPCSYAGHKCPLEIVKKTKKAVTVEHIHYDKTGNQRIFEVHGYPIFNDSGNVAQMIEYNLDITDRKEAEEELKESEERFRLLFENAGDGILIADIESKELVSANKKILELTGYSLEEMMKLSVENIHPKEDLNWILEGFKKQASGEVKVLSNVPVLKKNGDIIYTDINSSPFILKGKKYLVGLFRDITEKKKLEEERLKSSKLEAVNHMVVALNHKMNQPLSSIISIAEILKRRITSDKKFEDELTIMYEESWKLAGLIRKMQNLKSLRTTDYSESTKMIDLDE